MVKAHQTPINMMKIKNIFTFLILATNQKEFYIVNIVSPAGDKIKNINVINASDEYPEDIENLIKQSLKKHSVKS